MINALDQVTLNEIARMAWGSGSREGAAGGRGKIGLLVDTTTGKSRIIKYDTHLFSWSTADRNNQSQLSAADNLRHQLLTIAQNSGIRGEVLEEIRAKLGLERKRGDWHGTDLLDRTVVAQVVAMIDGDIWEKAFAGTDRQSYSTKNDNTSYATVSGEQDGERSASRTFHGADQIRLIGTHVTTACADARLVANQSLSDEEQESVKTFLSNVMAEFLPNAEPLKEKDLKLVAHSAAPFALIAIGRHEEARKYIDTHKLFEMPKGMRLFSAINKALKKANPVESGHLPDKVCKFLDELHDRDYGNHEDEESRKRIFKLAVGRCISRLEKPLIISRLSDERRELDKRYLSVVKDHMENVDPRFDTELDQIRAKQSEVDEEIASVNEELSCANADLGYILNYVEEQLPFTSICDSIVKA